MIVGAVSSEPAFRRDPIGAGGAPRVPEPTSPAFAIVGVGASAGGLEAFTELLRHLSPDTGMAFVLVQHLDPTHGSMLPDLLSSKTAMTVIEATDDLPVAPNTVYVIPAAEDMTIEQGVLKLSSRPASGQHLPIDSFLASLARDRKTRAVAVVLSGTASDGAAGVQAVSKKAALPWRRTQTPPSTRACPRTRSPPARSISSSRSRCSRNNCQSSPGIRTSLRCLARGRPLRPRLRRTPSWPTC